MYWVVSLQEPSMHIQVPSRYNKKIIVKNSIFFLSDLTKSTEDAAFSFIADLFKADNFITDFVREEKISITIKFDTAEIADSITWVVYLLLLQLKLIFIPFWLHQISNQFYWYKCIQNYRTTNIECQFNTFNFIEIKIILLWWQIVSYCVFSTQIFQFEEVYSTTVTTVTKSIVIKY